MRTRVLRSVLVGILGLVIGWESMVSVGWAGDQVRSLRADFNGDGYADLAIGVPQEEVGGKRKAGAVNVLYGSATGLTAGSGNTGVPQNQLWTQDSPGVLGVAEKNDEFGTAVAAGDFNGDGYADLAIGVPFEDVGGQKYAGAVNVLYGSALGLSAGGGDTGVPQNQLWTRSSPGIVGVADRVFSFGDVVAAGDFNGDGYTDLAVGVPQEDVGGKPDAGAVRVLYGSATGLTAGGGDTGVPQNQLWTQNSPGVLGAAEGEDFFGTSVAAGDFNGDGYADLAIGVPFEDVDGEKDGGAVNVLYGSAAGLSAGGGDTGVPQTQLWTQNSPGVLGVVEKYDEFGIAVAAGDFNGDGYADLAIGVHGENVGNGVGSGAVSVLYGSATGLTVGGGDTGVPQNQLWTRSSPGVVGDPDNALGFGFAVVAGDFNGDGYADLAIGVSGELVDGAQGAGAVNVLYGSGIGLIVGLELLGVPQNQLWTQNSPGVLGVAEKGDGFGYALTAGDFNADGYTDLAVGVPFEDVGEKKDAGAVNVLYGSAVGLTAGGGFTAIPENQLWDQGSPDILGVPEKNDHFGISLAF